jgi:hypothetical protein
LRDQVCIIALYDNPDFSPAIEYTFRLLLTGYEGRYKIIPASQFNPDEFDFDKSLIISYGKEFTDLDYVKQIHIYASDFFGKDYLKPSSMPETPLERHKGLPVICAGHGQLDIIIRKSEKTIETNIDIIAASFFMVSRYEEVIVDARDKYGRFPASASVAYREGFLDRPVVNEYIELLRSWIRTLVPGLEPEPFWPDYKDFAFCLTHDVDAIRRYSARPPLMRIASAILGQRSPRLALSIAMEYLLVLLNLRKDPYDTFDYMLELEKFHRIKSSFYFMSGGISPKVAYDITEPQVTNLINQLEGEGCEIGLHASYDSFNEPSKMAEEKLQLNNVVSNPAYGCRQHALRWKTPNTWRIQEKLGILYDTSLTYADHVGFRGGICLPYQPFDVIENRQLNIWELPLTVMEGSLQNPRYQNLSPNKACEEIIRHIDTVRKFHGVFVLLWHNSSFYLQGGWKDWREIYETVLKYVDGKNALTCNGREIIEHWISKHIKVE